jgi:Mg-chelatase subunit ChlD
VGKRREAFEIISLAKLEDVRAAQELRRLKEVTNARFFGIRIVSHRVIFILDVSGSMEEKMRLQVEGETALTRMAVARRELIAAIQGLARGALFNLITFSSGVDSWLEGGVASADTVSREEAEAFVARQIPGGGTNLYEAIQLAFEDPDVDTIFILSDGEPSVGEVVDVGQIREEVARWNEHRKIKINTIGVGLKLKILEWLSEDSGGRHVKLR